uniref:Uncharacterized protein n=1 Tax=Nelumbo nucifera TaxID=4432 RepID=A0A822YT64_NELNU|nr:TPA_asm: hypothetical protein HUJ06_005249 [Nelumbo nucifera]
MEVLLRASFATPFSSTSSKCVHRERVLNNHVSSLIFGSGISSLCSFSPQEFSIIDRAEELFEFLNLQLESQLNVERRSTRQRGRGTSTCVDGS